MYFTRIGIVAFSAAVVAGPWYTADGYSLVHNLISELAAQNTRNSIIMVIGFLALGLAIVADGARRFQYAAIPFIAFGAFMALAGLFGHKPIDPTIPYSEFAHNAHSALASLAGVSITIALLWYAIRAGRRSKRIVAISLAIL